jgi:STE24 endopeptidase
MFALISGCLVTILSKRMEGLDRLSVQVLTAVGGAFMLIKWGLLFGWISRKFERQADLFGVHTLALAGVDCRGECPLHRPAGGGEPRGAVCSAAANLFSDTLNEVARLNNIPPEAWSWRHGSIALRSRIVHEYAIAPERHAAFERSVARVKGLILAGALTAAAWAAWELRIWRIFGLGE